MYICKDQLGIEREYEQRLMPDGKFNVDGFIVVFDTSLVPNRQLEKQVEVCTQILNCIMKTKRPVVVAATKCDEANELLVRELERLVNRKELKAYNIPVVETSAHQNINVDAAFFAVAQLVDKTRGRSRVYSYIEAAAARRDLLDAVTDGYAQLLRAHVQDYGVLWGAAVKRLAQFAEFQGYVDAFGRESAQRLFRRHVKKLKDEYLGEKVQRYIDLLPEVLHEMFPDFSTLGEG
jgi:Fe2+ transport system protein B